MAVTMPGPGQSVAVDTVIPKRIRCFLLLTVGVASLKEDAASRSVMFVIEALHPDGWRLQGTARLEYWACQEAQMRCCSDGRNYRIRDEQTNQIIALVNTSSCRLAPIAR